MSKSTEEQAKQSAAYYLKAWGENPLPPMALATLITAQHMRPFTLLPMIFPPIFLFSTYMNVAGYKLDSAGTTAAWSGIYLLLAGRRKQKIMNKFGARGVIRGATVGLCLANMAGGGWAWIIGWRRKEEEGRGGL